MMNDWFLEGSHVDYIIQLYGIAYTKAIIRKNIFTSDEVIFTEIDIDGLMCGGLMCSNIKNGFKSVMKLNDRDQELLMTHH